MSRVLPLGGAGEHQVGSRGLWEPGVTAIPHWKRPMEIIEDSSAPKGALRVLLVEDSSDDARLLERELESLGYRVETTRVETRAALESALDSGSWDVLLCHQARPELNALSTLEVVKSREVDVPFISIVSSPRAETMAIEAMWGGAHDL